MDAVILAAGQGLRLRSVTECMPKALLRVCGIPLLERLLTSLESSGVSGVFCVVRYRKKLIRNFLRNRSNMIRIRLIEASGDSVADSYLSVAGRLHGQFILLPCDVVLDPSELKWLLRNLRTEQTAVGVARTVSQSNPLPVVVDGSGFVTAAGTRLEHPTHYFTGICCITTELMHALPNERLTDWSEIFDLSGSMLKDGLRMKAYEVSHSIDVDTADQLEQAERFLGC